MRCLIIGASMSMPSTELEYENTWVYKIIKAFPNVEFIDKCRRASSALRLITEGQNSNGFDLLEFYKPNIVITHFGITDSYPRLLRRNSRITHLINRLPRPISNQIYNIIRKTKGRTISCNDLTTKQFYECFSQYCNRASKLGTKVYIIKIAHCNDIVISKSPEVIKSIDMYNQVFDQLEKEFSNVKTIIPLPNNINLNSSGVLQSDGIHLTPKGEELLYNNIVKEMSYILQSNR